MYTAGSDSYTGSVVGKLSLALQIILPINGLCTIFKDLPFEFLQKAGKQCLLVLKEPST